MALMSYQILSGPSRSELNAAFFDLVDGRRQSVEFTTGESMISVVITGLSWGDESGENWLFRGYTTRHVRGTSSHARVAVEGAFRPLNGRGQIDLKQ